MSYNSKITGTNVEKYLEKIQDDNWGVVFSLSMTSMNEGESNTLSDEDAANLKNAIENQYYIRFITHSNFLDSCDTVLYTAHISKTTYKIVTLSSYSAYSKNEIREYSFSDNIITCSRVIILNDSSDVIFDFSKYDNFDALSKADSTSLKAIFGTPSDWNKWRQCLGANNGNSTEVTKTYNLFIKTSATMSQIIDVGVEYTDENNASIVLTSVGFGNFVFFGKHIIVLVIGCQDGVYYILNSNTTP